MIYEDLEEKINNALYSIVKTIPKYIAFDIITPKTLSRIITGKYPNTIPRHVTIIFNNMAWITLNRTNFVNGTVPREQTIKIPTIKMNIRYIIIS